MIAPVSQFSEIRFQESEEPVPDPISRVLEASASSESISAFSLRPSSESDSLNCLDRCRWRTSCSIATSLKILGPECLPSAALSLCEDERAPGGPPTSVQPSALHSSQPPLLRFGSEDFQGQHRPCSPSTLEPPHEETVKNAEKRGLRALNVTVVGSSFSPAQSFKTRRASEGKCSHYLSKSWHWLLSGPPRSEIPYRDAPSGHTVKELLARWNETEQRWWFLGRLAGVSILVIVLLSMNVIANNDWYEVSPKEKIKDSMHDWFKRVNARMADDRGLYNGIMISGSLMMDCTVLIVWLRYAIFGDSTRLPIAYAILYISRAMMRIFCILPFPEGYIWRTPEINGVEIKSLSVPYQPSDDFFFSGHIGCAVLSAAEHWRTRFWFGWIFSIVTLVFEWFLMVSTRGHYTIDLITGGVVAHWAHLVADQLSVYLDRMIRFPTRPILTTTVEAARRAQLGTEQEAARAEPTWRRKAAAVPGESAAWRQSSSVFAIRGLDDEEPLIQAEIRVAEREAAGQESPLMEMGESVAGAESDRTAVQESRDLVSRSDCAAGGRLVRLDGEHGAATSWKAPLYGSKNSAESVFKYQVLAVAERDARFRSWLSDLINRGAVQLCETQPPQSNASDGLERLRKKLRTVRRISIGGRRRFKFKKSSTVDVVAAVTEQRHVRLHHGNSAVDAIYKKHDVAMSNARRLGI